MNLIVLLVVLVLPLTIDCKNNTTDSNDIYQQCIRPDIEQFPKSIFNQNQRLNGAVLIHFLIAFYMFIGLSIVCDDYFVPSLEEICKSLKLKEDVAGATLMAAGSSAPELATTLIGLFIARDVDIGIGTVVGSAVFNILIVISVIACLSGTIITLNWFPLVRDSLFYLISIIAMILIIMDERVYWYEALSLLILYTCYIVFMGFNNKVEKWIKTKIKVLRPESGEIIDISNIGNYDTLEDDNKSIDGTISEVKSPFSYPHDSSLLKKIIYFINFPLNLVLYYTIPKPTIFPFIFSITFMMSLVWLSLFSYVMVWMITIIGYTFSIPDTIMGITFIAFGASVEDVLSSLNVARKGHGDMAVSNAIGSNVFDILICLGLPWLLNCALLAKSGFIDVKSTGLTYSTLTLLGTVLFLIVSIHLNKWKLDKKLGVLYFIVYILFIGLASFYEFKSNVKMCLDSLW